ncbi:MAG: hypothetical protein L0H25_04475 [Micrococcales bacterium]|nr:hypothetical protein [Micrococcales bacterium]
MGMPFRLHAGDPAPRQQTGTTCGSACLTVSRMLVDEAFAGWIREGIEGIGEDARDIDDAPRATEVTDSRTPIERFGAYEQVVARRTNALVGAGGRWQPPWPRALGTPPWGAINELECGAADPEADFDLQWCRLARRRRLEKAYAALRARVRERRPALLYIGNAWLPRHVVLVLPATGSGADARTLDVYEPSVGRVVNLPRESFVSRRLRLAGWDHPWAIVWDDSVTT